MYRQAHRNTGSIVEIQLTFDTSDYNSSYIPDI